MKGNKKGGKPMKGFGFADAMFGIKDITSEYEEIGNMDQEQTSFQPQPPPPKPVINKNIPSQNKKVNVIKVEQIKQKSVKMPAQTSNKDMEFKIKNPEKDHGSLKMKQLIPIEACENVYELTNDCELSQWEYNVFCEGIEISNIVPDAVVSFNFGSTDILQGGLGNCYFVATLASMAHQNKILRQRIPKFKSYSHKTQIYDANLFESGKLIKIPVENLFPKVFIKPVANDISPMILEKAYAQAYGNFSVLNNGHACDSLRDLTGAPTEYIDLKNKDMLIYKLKEAFSERFPLVIASKATTSLNKLAPKHSYHILDFKSNEKKDIHLKIRDPRGHNFTNFPHSHKEITEEQAENGVFWVNYALLLQNFEVITSCKSKYGNQYFFKTFKSNELTENYGSIIMTVKKPMNVAITVHQKNKKFFDTTFKYGMIKLLLAEVSIGKNGSIAPIRTIAADFKTQQICNIETELTPGTYMILGQACPVNKSPKIPKEAMTISIYSSSNDLESMEFEQGKGNVPIQPFLIDYIGHNQDQFQRTISDQRLERYVGPLFGFMCMYYRNRSGKSVIEELTYQVQNITIREKKVALKPNQEKILIHPIGQANNCSHKFSTKSKTLYKS